MPDLTLTGDGPTITSIPQLREAVAGQVIEPGDAEYDRARTVFLGGIDRRPAVIVRPAGAGDVAHVLAFARSSGLRLAVRSGGHSVHSVCDDGIVLDLSSLNTLTIDPERRTAWVEPGLTAGEYTAAAGAHGLATGFGDTGSVGIGGITLGGGIGFLVRKFGMTIDDLLAAEVVTADGELLQVDADNHPDLFWAIRGGGGNFGVVTRFQFQLHEVGPIVGGMMFLPVDAEILSSFLALADAAPDELSTIANVMTAPPMPFIPEELHGEPVLMAQLAYVGDVEEGQRVIAPFKALAEPFLDMVAPISYPEMYMPDEEGYHPVTTNRTMFVDTVDDDAVKTILEQLRASSASMAVTQLRALGGAMARVPVEDTAFAHRDRRFMVTVAAVYEDPAEHATHEEWADALAAALRNGPDGAYVNFLSEDGPARIREAYPGATWDRLTELKRRYDPENLFRFNTNIPPA
ncbi:FAD-binding oxidoreductase [Longispora sp. K20-0274]|uniref:FAD-binding oxidoreductase n=1 Tax=Longispora sp. K20-0274 TaxID=3088255 RepID=UPI00399BA55F